MPSKQAPITAMKIMTLFMDHSLENNKLPESVYLFCKSVKIKEKDFYQFFGSLEALEKVIFKEFFIKTINLLAANEDYRQFDFKDKLLSFYFTFFEILTANRSYVALALKKDKIKFQQWLQLSELRKVFKQYIEEISIDHLAIQQEIIQKIRKKAIGEGAWLQLLITLKFWLNDGSPAFEKTDIFIEKSVHTSFELLNTAPLESLIDLGKFLYNEKIK